MVEIRLETIECKQPSRGFGYKHVIKKGMRKYVCFIPVNWTIEHDEEIDTYISDEAIDEISKALIKEIEDSRND